MLTAIRIVLHLIHFAVVTLDGILFAGLVHSVSDLLEASLAGIVFGTLGLWVTFSKVATLPQKLAHEMLLNIALVFAAYRSVAQPVAESAKSAGIVIHCGWSMFLYFVRNGTVDLWCQFLAVWAVGRLLIWAIKQMSHDAKRAL